MLLTSISLDCCIETMSHSQTWFSVQYSCFYDIAPLILWILSLIVFKMYDFKIKQSFFELNTFLIGKDEKEKQQKRGKPDKKSLSSFSYSSKEVGQWFLLFNIKGLIFSLWHFLSSEGECLSLCVFNIISLSGLLFLFVTVLLCVS